jgi:hypothetical protein
VTSNRSPFLALAVMAPLLFTALPASGGDTPFKALDGAWNGSGNVKLENGKTERLKCKGYYNAKDGGNGLGMAINCGNASFKINMRATLTYAGGQVSGTWEEREFNQTGNVTGKATADKLTLSIGGAISGTMAISMTGTAQTVSISTGGPGFTGVNLQFAKSS